MLRTLVHPQHPTESHVQSLNFVTFWHEPTIQGAFYKNVHVFGTGQLIAVPPGARSSWPVPTRFARPV